MCSTQSASSATEHVDVVRGEHTGRRAAAGDLTDLDTHLVGAVHAHADHFEVGMRE